MRSDEMLFKWVLYDVFRTIFNSKESDSLQFVEYVEFQFEIRAFYIHLVV